MAFVKGLPSVFHEPGAGDWAVANFLDAWTWYSRAVGSTGTPPTDVKARVRMVEAPLRLKAMMGRSEGILRQRAEFFVAMLHALKRAIRSG